jgi:hypothetical protein
MLVHSADLPFWEEIKWQYSYIVGLKWVEMR